VKFTRIVAIAIVIFGLFGIYRNYSFIQKSSKATGKVVKLKAFNTSQASNKSVIEFKDLKGNLWRVVPKVRPKMLGLKQGEKITVYYNQNDPYQFKVGKFLYIWFYPTLFIVAGLIYLGLSLRKPR